MKNLSILLVLFIVIGITTGCSEDEHISPFGDYSSLTWWSYPNADYALTEKTITVNKQITFKDLSHGIISHEWQIQEGAKFLTSTFTESDTIYDDFINPKLGLTTSESLAYVLFTETGVSEVHLINTFKDSVAESVKEGDVWKVDKTFTITVID